MSIAKLHRSFRHKQFFGRQQDLETLDQALRAAPYYRYPILISGLHGIGKTSLVYEALMRLERLRDEHISYINFQFLDGHSDADLLSSAGAVIISSLVEASRKDEYFDLYDAVMRLPWEHVVVLDEIETLEMEGDKKKFFFKFIQPLLKLSENVERLAQVILITRKYWPVIEPDVNPTTLLLPLSAKVCVGCLSDTDAQTLFSHLIRRSVTAEKEIAPALTMAGGHPWLIEIIGSCGCWTKTKPLEVEELWDEVYDRASISFKAIWNSLELDDQLLIASRSSSAYHPTIEGAYDDRLKNLRLEGLLTEDHRMLFSPLFAYWIVANRDSLLKQDANELAEQTHFSVTSVKGILDAMNSGSKLLETVASWFGPSATAGQ